MSARSAAALRGALVPVLVAAVWEGSARAHWVADFVLPPLSRVCTQLGRMAITGELWTHLGASVGRVLGGFLLGALAGVSLGLPVALSRRTEAYVDPALQALRAVPSLAWVPLLLLWMGIGEAPKVTLIAIGAFFPVYVNLVSGVRGVDRHLIEVATVHGLSRAERIGLIILPGALPAVFTGLRTGLTIAWLYVVAAELMAAQSGLGFLLTDGRELSRADLIFAAILPLAACGKVSDGLLRTVERRLLRWRDAPSDA